MNVLLRTIFILVNFYHCKDEYIYSFKFTVCKCYKFTKSLIDKAVPKTDPTVPNPMIKVFLTTTQTLRSGYLISKSMTQGMIMDKDAVVTEPKRATILSSW